MSVMLGLNPAGADALLRAFPLDDAGSVRYCALIDAFLPLFDDYLLSAGLLSL